MSLPILATDRSALPLQQLAQRCAMQHFHLYRMEDPTGVSGIGRVAEGVVFSNGWVAMTWLSDQPSMSFYTSIAQVEAIHGHNGTTRVVLHADACNDVRPGLTALGRKPNGAADSRG